MSTLFSPYAIGSLQLKNRIVIAPMCQYSAVDGAATDWHVMHLGHLALSGAGLLIIEATAVEPIGRITPGCLGLWYDATEAALRPRAGACARIRACPSPSSSRHAGRKASSHAPWDGGQLIPPDAARRLAAGGAFGAAAAARRGAAAGAGRRRAGARASRPSSMPRSARIGWASTRSRCMARTAICCTSSCRRSSTAQRRLWRLPGKPHALSAGGVRGRARGLAGAMPVGLRVRPPTGSRAAGTAQSLAFARALRRAA